MMTAVPGRMASATVSVILVDTPGGNAEMRLRAAFDAAGGMGPPEILVVEEADPEALARARNKGADRAVGDILAFLAPGAAPEPGWLEAVVAAFRDDASLAAIAPTRLGESRSPDETTQSPAEMSAPRRPTFCPAAAPAKMSTS